MNRRIVWLIWIFAAVWSLSFQSKAQDAVEPVDPEFLAFFAAIYNDPVERASLRLDDFAERMKINDKQNAEWRAFKNMFLDLFEKRRTRLEDFRLVIEERNGKPLSTPESIDLKIHSLQQQIADTQSAQLVIQKLYLKLDDTQKAIFDQGMRALWFKNKMRHRRF